MNNIVKVSVTKKKLNVI